MVKKLLTLLFTSMLALPLASTVFAQDTPAKEMAAKLDRWEGRVVRSNPDKSSLTVRKVGATVEKTVVYDSSTQWTSQEHGSKTVNTITSADVKDDDRVICRGTWNKDGTLHATMISKRLTN